MIIVVRAVGDLLSEILLAELPYIDRFEYYEKWLIKAGDSGL